MKKLALAGLMLGLLVSWSGTGLASSLSIEPLRQSLTLAPGEAVERTIAVENSGTLPATASISAEAFDVTDELYDYKLDASSDLVKWVFIPVKSVQLAPRQQYVFHYTINAPAEIEPGGRYITVVASLASQPAQGVQSINQAASLIYINISGQTTSKGRLIDLNAPWFTTSPPVNLDIRVQNGGNTHYRSRQTVTIINLWGRTLAQQTATPLILPGTVRLTSAQFRLGNWPGLYRISAKIGLGDNPAANRQLWLVYLPPEQTLILGVMVAAGIFVIISEFRRHRQR